MFISKRQASLLITALFSSNHGAFASEPVDIEVTNTLFNLLNVYDNCPDQVAALETCQGGNGSFTSCVDCAWTDLLDGSENPSCDVLLSQAAGDYSKCTLCEGGCDEELNLMLVCAVDLYCGGDEQPKLANNFLRTESDAGTGSTCFSLESTVIVKDKGLVSIKDLVVGDSVLSDDKDTYTKYYSIGHYNENVPTKFLRIFTESSAKPLEVTPGHMVLTASDELPVPAYSVKVGDVLRVSKGTSKVTFVREISRKGLFNPLTLSGTIVVDGIVSSIHSEESGFSGPDAGWIYLGGCKLVHWHTLMHFIHAPHRMICGKFIRCNEDLNRHGLVPFDKYLAQIHALAEEKQSVIYSMFFLFVVGIPAFVFSVMELLADHVITVVFALVGYWAYTKKFHGKIKAKVV